MALRRLPAALIAAAALIGCPVALASSAPIVTIAGNGQAGPYPGTSGVAATSVPLGSAVGVAPNTLGSGIVFADPNDNRLLGVDGLGRINLIAGNGTAGGGPSGTPGGGDDTVLVDQAEFRGPRSIASYTVSFEIGFIVADTTNECTRFVNAGLYPVYVYRDAGSCNYTTALEDGTHFTGPRDVEPLQGSTGSYYVADGARV